MRGMWLAAVAACVGVGGAANAAEIDQQFGCYGNQDCFGNDVIFDQSLGTLQSVGLTITSFQAYGMYYIDTHSPGANQAFSLSATFTLTAERYGLTVSSTALSTTMIAASDNISITPVEVTAAVNSTPVSSQTTDNLTGFEVPNIYGNNASPIIIPSSTFSSASYPDLTVTPIYHMAGVLASGYLSFVYQPASTSVPEPATWATLLVGFGAIGAAMRRRSITASA